MSNDMDLSVWEKRLLRVVRDTAPKEHRKIVRKAGNLLRKNVRRETAKVNGELRRSYRTKTKEDTATVYTDKFYAKMVEEGHAIVLRRNGEKEKVGFVPGKFYFKKGLDKTEKELPQLLKELLHTIGKGLGMDVSG
ncbi:MAG: HK97 gp10 family phage protein [Dehalobacter sp.]|nr:HK97 gp10 family phage protein [Dehalobacter sp.]